MACNFIKKRFQHRRFSANIAKIIRTAPAILQNSQHIKIPIIKRDVVRTPQTSEMESLARQKGEFQNACFKETKYAKFSKKQTFLPLDTHTYVRVSRGKKCSFFGKFYVLSFLQRPILKFALLPYYRRIISSLAVNY